MAQTNKICEICKELGHSKFYCKKKPVKHIKRVNVVKTPIKKKPKVKRVSRGQLVKKLDTAYSQYIRAKDSVGGESTCVTCGDIKPWKQHQNGHFYSRGRYATRWDDDNCHPQCMACNIFLKGNYINYTMYMIDRYGRDYVDNLEIKSKSSIKLTTVELKEMIEKYRLLVKT